MTKIILNSGLAALAILLTTQASAATITYSAVLSAANEVPPVTSPAFGSATLTLTGDSLSVFESFSGLIGGPAAAAHIHCCSAAGTNAPVVVPFNAFPNATAGTYSGVFDLTSTTVYTTAFLAASGGTAANAEAALVAGLNSDLTYVNIHDPLFPGGEIRGFITRTPEPGTLWTAGVFMAIALFRCLNHKRGVRS